MGRGGACFSGVSVCGSMRTPSQRRNDSLSIRGGWPPRRARSRARGPNLEAHTFHLLQVGDDFKQVAGLGIAPGSEHPHQAFRRAAGNAAQFGESNRGIDEKAKKNLPPFHLTRKKDFYFFSEERPSKNRIALFAPPGSFF